MKWGLAVSLLLPYVAAILPPYKRFVSPPNLRFRHHLKTSINGHRNPEQMGSAGVHVKTHPTITYSVVISKFLSIGQMNPPEKRGSRSPNMVLQIHPGRVLSFPTQVLPLLSFPESDSHSLVPQVVLADLVSTSSSDTVNS